MKSFDNIIQPELGESIRSAIRHDRRIQDLISRIVPVSTAEHIVFCRLHEERLRITVDNAVWLPRLRFMERQIIDILRAERLEVTSVSCHVMPEEKDAEISQRKANSASPNATSLINATAQDIADERDDDNRLGAALQKMARLLSERD